MDKTRPRKTRLAKTKYNDDEDSPRNQEKNHRHDKEKKHHHDKYHHDYTYTFRERE
jgi:hypothetical protein